jgi:hypothetical protein
MLDTSRHRKPLFQQEKKQAFTAPEKVQKWHPTESGRQLPCAPEMIA